MNEHMQLWNDLFSTARLMKPICVQCASHNVYSVQCTSIEYETMMWICFAYFCCCYYYYFSLRFLLFCLHQVFGCIDNFSQYANYAYWEVYNVQFMQCFVNFVAKIWREKHKTVQQSDPMERWKKKQQQRRKRTKWMNGRMKKWKTKLFKCVFYCFSVLVHRSFSSKLSDLFIFPQIMQKYFNRICIENGFLSGWTYLCSFTRSFEKQFDTVFSVFCAHQCLFHCGCK